MTEQPEVVEHQEEVQTLVNIIRANQFDSKLEFVHERNPDLARSLAQDTRDFNFSVFRKYATKQWLDSIPYPYTAKTVYDRRGELFKFLYYNPDLGSCDPVLCRQRLVNRLTLQIHRFDSVPITEVQAPPRSIEEFVSLNVDPDLIDKANRQIEEEGVNIE